jgi:hypothetical protein
MSTDAKAWYDESGNLWKAVHDGECDEYQRRVHTQGARLGEVLVAVEACIGEDLRWEIRTYPDGKTGLVGWVV